MLSKFKKIPYIRNQHCSYRSSRFQVKFWLINRKLKQLISNFHQVLRLEMAMLGQSLVIIWTLKYKSILWLKQNRRLSRPFRLKLKLLVVMLLIYHSLNCSISKKQNLCLLDYRSLIERKLQIKDQMKKKKMLLKSILKKTS